MLDESEILELIEFDPSVEPNDTWDLPSSNGKLLRETLQQNMGGRGERGHYEGFFETKLQSTFGSQTG